MTPFEEPSSAYNPDGSLKPQAWINILVALLLRHGGSFHLSQEELTLSCDRQVEYEPTEYGLLLSLVEQQKGTA